MRLNPERARQLRDKERGLTRHHPLAPQSGTRKHREIRFAKLPPGQAEQAQVLLGGLDGLQVGPGIEPNSLSVWYEVSEYTLEGRETALGNQGFHLSNTLYCKLVRALVYYCEETQLSNMRGPERLLKKSNEAYSQAWDRHLHGDHDDTPADLRQDR
jgi:hypothetical protein